MPVTVIAKLKQKAGSFALIDVEDLDPTQGAVADGQLLKRSGSEVVVVADTLHAAATLAAAPDTITDLMTVTGQELSLDAQAANRFLAGPTSGGAADPTFRIIDKADMPNATDTANFTIADRS